MEDLKALITESIFNYRWTLLEMWHQVGKAVVKNEWSNEEAARGTGRRRREIHYARELYKHYPRLESLPEGKNISWDKLHKYLPPYEANKTKEGK
jgi:hypothetical protein